ncbi:hypothetical protein M8J76_016158 [Diaphorina citri]|nr:hypothetical protein M8J76_016158 [Diaphorina citri]
MKCWEIRQAPRRLERKPCATPPEVLDAGCHTAISSLLRSGPNVSRLITLTQRSHLSRLADSHRHVS